jgi:hypothetical protein
MHDTKSPLENPFSFLVVETFHWNVSTKFLSVLTAKAVAIATADGATKTTLKKMGRKALVISC